MKKILYTLAITILCVVISSCSKDDAPSAQQNTKNLLIGTWVSDYDNDWDEYIELELKSNGQGTIYEEYYSDYYGRYVDDEYSFRWEYIYNDGDEYLILFIDEGDEGEEWEWVFEIKNISDRKLVLECDGDEFEFEKE